MCVVGQDRNELSGRGRRRGREVPACLLPACLPAAACLPPTGISSEQWNEICVWETSPPPPCNPVSLSEPSCWARRAGVRVCCCCCCGLRPPARIYKPRCIEAGIYLTGRHASSRPEGWVRSLAHLPSITKRHASPPSMHAATIDEIMQSAKLNITVNSGLRRDVCVTRSD